jgi:hypothetical protein
VGCALFIVDYCTIAQVAYAEYYWFGILSVVSLPGLKMVNGLGAFDLATYSRPFYGLPRPWLLHTGGALFHMPYHTLTEMNIGFKKQIFCVFVVYMRVFTVSL